MFPMQQSMLDRILIGFLTFVGALVLLAGLHACTPAAQPQKIPEGPITMTGVLQTADLSIVRRGTHVLLQSGEPVYFAESSRIDLRDFEGVDAVFDGHVEYNTDLTELPVLVVSGASILEIAMREWAVPDLELFLKAPELWEGHIFENGIRFTLPGSEHVVASLIHDDSQESLPTGTPLQIAGRPAVRSGAGGIYTAFIRVRDTTILRFDYTPQTSHKDPMSERMFLRVLRAITFTNQPPSPSSVTTGTGSASGVPCGGPAGVLCPTGQYCEVTDPSTDIGRCRALAH